MNTVGEPFRVGFTFHIQVKAADSKSAGNTSDNRADLIPYHSIPDSVCGSLTSVLRKCAGRGNQNDIGISGKVQIRSCEFFEFCFIRRRIPEFRFTVIRPKKDQIAVCAAFL